MILSASHTYLIFDLDKGCMLQVYLLRTKQGLKQHRPARRCDEARPGLWHEIQFSELLTLKKSALVSQGAFLFGILIDKL